MEFCAGIYVKYGFKQLKRRRLQSAKSIALIVRLGKSEVGMILSDRWWLQMAIRMMHCQQDPIPAQKYSSVHIHGWRKHLTKPSTLPAENLWWMRRERTVVPPFITSQLEVTCRPNFMFFFQHWRYIRSSLKRWPGTLKGCERMIYTCDEWNDFIWDYIPKEYQTKEFVVIYTRPFLYQAVKGL